MNVYKSKFKQKYKQSQLFMNIPEHIFRAYDIRGLHAEVTSEIARSVGLALVSKTEAKTVIIGRDMRATSFDLQQSAMNGIIATGSNVIDIGLCSTSMFNFAVSSQPHIDAGLMITASHNPPEYNGMKMALASGQPVSGIEILAEVGRLGVIGEEQGVKNEGQITTFDILPSYVEQCLRVQDLPDCSGARVVVDYGNGMGAMSLRAVAKRLNVELIELYPEPDARFPNHEANPAKEETLADAKAMILRERADFGMAIDGDADRIGFIDNEGVSLRGDLMLSVLAKEVLLQNPGAKIVCSPNQSWVVTETIAESGGIAVECRVGRKFVVEAMQKQQALLGGEVSSHFFFSEFHGLEAVDHAFVRMLALWKKSNQSFADVVRPFRRYANSGEVNIEVQDKDSVLARIQDFYAPRASLINRLDGIRCEFNRDWWFIIRPSNTEPLLRLIVEATTQEQMEARTKELVEFITVTE